MSRIASPVPANRFGALLIQGRTTRGLDIPDMVKLSADAYDADRLSAVERGAAALDDRTVRDLTELYGVEKGSFDTRRSRLVVDLPTRQISVAGEALDLQPTSPDGPYQDRVHHILERYLALLYVLRQKEPGATLQLREPDMEVLSSTLMYEIDELERRLVELMASPRVDAGTKALLKRYLVPSAGLLVGAVALGSLVITAATDIRPAGASILQSATSAITASTVVEHGQYQDGRLQHQQAGATLSAITSVGSRSGAELAAIGAEAESMIGYDWQSILPDWKVIYADDSDVYKGLTHVPSKTITVYIDADATAADVAGVLAHEVAHAIDVSYFDDDTRVEWLKARDMPMVWWAGDGLNDFSVGAGDFAEAVAASWVDSPSDSNFGDFTPEQLAMVDRMLPST